MSMTQPVPLPNASGPKEVERSPFARLAELLAGHEPGKPLISLSLGEPQHPVPDFVGSVLAKHTAEFGRYPIAKGIEPFRKAAADWLGRRFELPRALDPESEVLVLNGSREGLFFAAIAAERHVGPRRGKPAILVPNPFYPVYGAGARSAGCETVLLSTGLGNDFLPDLDTLSDDLLARTVAFYIASPANPQGSVASRSYLDKLKSLADRLRLPDPQRRVLLGNLHGDPARQHAGSRRARTSRTSSRSSRCRSARTCRACASASPPATRSSSRVFHELRNVAAPQVPVPLQQVAVACYDDEAHVEENRRLYRLKFDLADQILGNRYGYKRPAGGFCVWLDISALGTEEDVTLRLYKEGGVRVIPGSFLARQQPDGSNPGKGYIRLALVQDAETTAEALHRLVTVLG